MAPKHDFEADVTEKAGYGSSDHTSFTAKQVPVLFFFSGLHADYHKPSDTWDKIDAPAAVRLLDLVSEVTEHLADAPAAAIRPRGRTAATGRGRRSRTRANIRRDMAPISAAFRISPRFPMESDSPTFAPDRPPTKPG